MAKYTGDKPACELEIRGYTTEKIEYTSKKTGALESFIKRVLGCELAGGNRCNISVELPKAIRDDVNWSPPKVWVKGAKVSVGFSSFWIENGTFTSSAKIEDIFT